MSKPGDSFAISMVGPPGDLPRVKDADQGRPDTSVVVRAEH